MLLKMLGQLPWLTNEAVPASWKLATAGWAKRYVAWKLLIVDSETITLSIGIDEETSLEERIRGMLNVRNQVGWCKG
jgi:hypothetical protein